MTIEPIPAVHFVVRAARRSMCALLLSSLALSLGCGGTQFQPANQRLTSSLRTAISSQRLEWLDQNVQLIEERKQSGEMRQAEYDALQPIIAQARRGEWREAEEALVALQRRQRPSRQQMQELEDSRRAVQRHGQSDSGSRPAAE